MNPTGDTPVTSQGLPMPPIDDNSSGHSPGNTQGGSGGGTYPYPATSFPQGYYPTNANYENTFNSVAGGTNTKYYPTGYPYPAGGSGPDDNPFPNNGRDLNYYGYNNGFGNNGGNGGDGGNFFATNSGGGDNNNKLSDSSVQPLGGQESTFGDTKVPAPVVKLESSSGDLLSDSNKSNSQLLKSDTTDNSDNQVDITRSHAVQEQDINDTLNKHSNSSPNPNQGLKRSLSPGSAENSTNSDNPNFETAQNTMSALGSSAEEYMRQGQMLGPDGMPTPYGLQMQYNQQPMTWDNYYNYPGSQQQQQQQQQHQMHMQQQPMMEGYGMSMDTWWQNQQMIPGAAGQPATGPGAPGQHRPEYNPGFRAPMQAPGAWMLRGAKPRNDRRGPGRPRIGPGGLPKSPRSAGQLMSPPPGSFSPFSTDLGSPGSGPPSEVTPGSPSPSGFPGDPHPGAPPNQVVPRPQASPNPPLGLGDPVVGGPPPPVGGPPVPGPPPPGGKAAAKTANANKKRYTCEVCQKRFSTAWYVRVHRKSHSGERPYICHNCGKGFMLPNVLQVHLRKCEKNNPNSNVSKKGPQSTPQPPIGVPPVVVPPDHPSDHPNPDMLHAQPAQVAAQNSPLPQQGFLAEGYNNGGYNQRYESSITASLGGVPTPPFGGQGGPGGGPPPGLPGSEMYERFLDPMYRSNTGGSDHFLANDRPPDKGGGISPQGGNLMPKRYDLKMNGYSFHHPGLSGIPTELPPSPSFSPGIPTPQSSVDSLTCYRSGGPEVTKLGGLTDPLAELTATVESTMS